MSLSRAEFEKLALEHLDMLYRIARRLAGDQTAAEDLVQETYLKAFRARADFKLQDFGIRPWLIRIMQNAHLSRSQREQRQPIAVDDMQLDAAAQSDAAVGGSVPPSDPASFDGMDERLVRAIESLPQEYQTVLLFWAVEEFSYKEIADALDIPIGTVMSRLHRARVRLSERLEDFARTERIFRK